MPTKKQTALAKKPPPSPLSKINQAFSTVMQSVTDALSQDLAPVQLTQVFAWVKDAADAVEAVEGVAKQRLLTYVLHEGVARGDKGTKLVQVEGGGAVYEVEARPRKTSYDDKKVEAMLRAKGLDVTLGMDSEVIYHVNESRLLTLHNAGKLSQAELESCKPELAYNLMRPKLLK